MKNRIYVALGALACFTLMCAPEDEDRCGKDYYWEDNTCWPDQEEDTASAEEDAGDQDADTGDLPSGLGDECTGKPDDCQGLEADKCLKNPADPTGYCTVEDCTVDPDDCPGDYHCCQFAMTPKDPPFCVSDAQWADMKGMCNQ